MLNRYNVFIIHTYIYQCYAHLLKYHKTNFNRHKNVTNKMQFRYAHTHVSLKMKTNERRNTKQRKKHKAKDVHNWDAMLAAIISVCRCNLSKKYMIARSRRHRCCCCRRRHHFTHIDFNFNDFFYLCSLFISVLLAMLWHRNHTYFMHTIAVIGIVENLLWD